MESTMLPHRRATPTGLWAITSYFNPARYRRKLQNYRAFRERLAVPLVTAELAFDGFDLDAGDADLLVRVRGGDVLWQKERLLNLAASALPDSCDAVAWIDCDVIFDDPDWPRAVARALERAELVHVFEERHNLGRDEPLDRLASWSAPATSMSLIHKLRAGLATHDELRRNNGQLERRSTTGLGWASPRRLVERHGFYDACILGGGDRVGLAAALGEFGHACESQSMNDRRARHFLGWARPYFEAVRGRVDAIPGRLFHLWHGDLVNRRYQERFRILEGFDPYADVTLDPEGVWRWSSDKPELHAAVRAYFAKRNEDGDEAVAGALALAAARPGG
jgi:hypothetical protein